MLIEFAHGKTSGFAIVTMQQELTHLLGDRTVALRTPKNSAATSAIGARAEVLKLIKR